jgi:diguanylate cyclase (GGDEF)-like protein
MSTTVLYSASGRWLPLLLGSDSVTRKQVYAVLFSAATYLLYSVIVAAQVAFGLTSARVALALISASGLANLLFYLLVRSGLARAGRDPGLARTQMVVGILFMYLGYAASGPAGVGLTIIMASHVVYAMFRMTPRDVWRLVGASLFGLGLTMLACGLLWPERFPAGVQAVGLMYASLVVPMIAALADRVTGMTQRLRSQRAELEQALARLKEVATRDELTGAHNRAHMTELLQMQFEQQRRTGAALSLALIDIDHFKHVNDRHGHATGDEVLRRFARQAQAELRAADVLARWGGEEFLVLMPNTASTDALQAMDRLQQTLAADGRCNLAERTVMPKGLVITFSAGVIQVGPEDSIDSAIDRADKAMYRAKGCGRARCVGA